MINVLVSGVSLDTVVSWTNWVSTVTCWVEFSLFLLGNLMLLIWDDNTCLLMNDWVINLEIGSSSSVGWGWHWWQVDASPNLAGSNNSVRKIFSQSNIWESKMLGALAIR